MALRFRNDDFYWVHRVQALAYAKLGMGDEANAAVQRLLELYPRFPSQARTELDRWLHPTRTKDILDSLRDAGVAVT